MNTTNKYTFICEELDEDGKVVGTTVKIVNTGAECWTGFDGPMQNFYDFLRGCGFLFNINDQIGIMSDINGEETFKGAIGW